MSLPKASIPTALCIIGLAAGFTAKKSSAPQTSEATRLLEQAQKIQRADIATRATLESTYNLVKVESADTLVTIIEKGETVTSNELAQWLLTASSDDIATYWAASKDLNPHRFFKNLVFVNWTRIDPLAAVNATAGTKDAGMAYWGWAANDPQAAISAVSPEWAHFAANSIGQHQPQWLRDHLDQIPDAVKDKALNGMTTWKEDSDHAARLDFLEEQGRGFHSSTFRTFARKDPWAAYDWLQENDKFASGRWQSGPAEILINTMAEEHPEDLERLAEITPASQLKWKMEDVIFEKLISSDQDAALDFANKIEPPLIASKRLAQIGTKLLDSDPEKAFEIASEILAKTPDQLDSRTFIKTGNYGSETGNRENSTESFIRALASKNPERVMEMVAIASAPDSQTFSTLGYAWAGQDLESYTSWLGRQDDAKVYKSGASQVAYQLTRNGQFEEASQWALSSYDKQNPGAMYQLAYQWTKSDPEKAKKWIETADIEESARVTLQGIINRNR